jgi:hypothetical protein
MKLKVKTTVDLTQEQREALQRLGCEAKPFITWPHTLIFAATATEEQEQSLRSMECVTQVEPMPVYRLA